jgi:hypothetical protein
MPYRLACEDFQNTLLTAQELDGLFVQPPRESSEQYTFKGALRESTRPPGTLTT